jgi:hypothetical protein
MFTVGRFSVACVVRAALSGLALLAGCSVSARFAADDRDVGDAGRVCTACNACEQSLPIASAQHVSGPVDYDDPPPVGGPHNSCWGSWGVQQTELRAERWVHNMEHGGVVFLYRCDEPCPADVKTLEALVADRPRTLLTSYPRLPTRFAVVAWGHRLTTDCLDADAFAAFYAAHVDHGRESISSDPPAACTEFPDL